MPDEPLAQQHLATAYQRGARSILVLALTPEQRQQFCQAVVRLAQAECARMLPYMQQHRDSCVAEALAKAQAWIDNGTWPSDTLQRRFDDFYNPFWLAFTTVTNDIYECATAAAYCTERAVQSAWGGEWAAACNEATLVADVVAQAARADHRAARASAEQWYTEVAWALLRGHPPPPWPVQPVISVAAS